MLGIDIVKNARIESTLCRFGFHFLNKVYTSAEINLCKNNIQCLAGRFASKEASIKAFFRAFNIKTFLKDFEILKAPNGMPVLNVLNKDVKTLMVKNRLKAFVSISHEKEYTVAVCYIIKEEVIC